MKDLKDQKDVEEKEEAKEKRSEVGGRKSEAAEKSKKALEAAKGAYHKHVKHRGVAVYGFLKARWKTALGLVLILGLGWMFFGGENGKQSTESYTVEMGTLRQEVSVTGQVKASSAVDLGFERSGKVAQVFVDVGDRVEAGQQLVVLENADLNAKVLQAEASIQAAQANYQARQAELATSRAEVTSAQAGIENEQAQLLQFESALEEAQQQLAETKRGTRPEELEVSRTTVSNRENEVTDLETELVNALKTADQNLEGILEEGRDQVADAAAAGTNILSENLLEIIYPIRFPSNKTCEPQVSAFINLRASDCFDALKAVEALEERVVEMSSEELSQEGVLADLDQARDALEHVRVLVLASLELADAALAPISTGGTASTSFTDAQLAALKTPITNGRDEVEAALQQITTAIQNLEAQVVSNETAIDAAQSALNRAKDSLESAEVDLELKEAGSTPEQIAASEAKVKQAEANLAAQQASIKQAQTAPSAQQAKIDLAQANLNAQAAQIQRERANKSDAIAQLDKTIITAPFPGVITIQEADVGEIISANSVVVGLISDAQFEIEANIPEVDIAKVKLDDPADITLDAYGPDEIFPAKVMRIDPAETVIDDVTNYQVLFRFLAFDERVLSGMTANIELLTREWPDVLFVPEFALIREDDQVFVMKLVGKDPSEEGALEKVAVEIGNKSTDGFRIITEGLEEGDTIVHVLNE